MSVVYILKAPAKYQRYYRCFNFFQLYQYFSITKCFFFIKMWTIFMDILYNTLKTCGTQYHLNR